MNTDKLKEIAEMIFNEWLIDWRRDAWIPKSPENMDGERVNYGHYHCEEWGSTAPEELVENDRCWFIPQCIYFLQDFYAST